MEYDRSGGEVTVGDIHGLVDDANVEDSLRLPSSLPLTLQQKRGGGEGYPCHAWP